VDEIVEFIRDPLDQDWVVLRARVDTECWDRPFEQDAAECRRDAPADEAPRDRREGRCIDA
jgi:hypothetical protein